MVDSTRQPFFNLDTSGVHVLYWLTESGGFPGVVLVIVMSLLWLVVRKGSSPKRMLMEGAICALVITLLAGGGARLNEHGVKDYFAAPRPNISDLVETGVFAPQVTTVEDFYRIYPDKASRGDAIFKVFDTTAPPLALAPIVVRHWSKETAYSFPSGHAYAAMLIGTFFWGLGLSFVTGRQRWFFYGLLVWAIAVCYSRPALRVHTPMDVSIGGLTGILVGIMGFVLVRWLMGRFARQM